MFWYYGLKEGNLNKKYLIRICSAQPLGQAVFSAAISPLEIADYMESIYGVSRANLILDISNKCLSSKDKEVSAVEFWRLGDDENFRIEKGAYPMTSLHFKSIGFDPLECNNPSFAVSVRQAINAMKDSKRTFLAVIGIYLEKPSKELIQNIGKIRSRLQLANINEDRFALRKDKWHFGDSACSYREPKKPAIYLLILPNQKIEEEKKEIK